MSPSSLVYFWFAGRSFYGMKTRVYKFIHTGSIGKALVLRDSLSTTVILWVLNAFSFLKPEFLMHSFGSEAWRPFCLQICTCRIDRVSWTRGTRIRHSVKNWMVKTEEWTFDTLKECYCLNYTYRGSIKTWAHSYSGKARKNMFFASRTPPHNTQVSQERFWSKNEKSIFDDDVILDDDTILDDDVMLHR